MSELNRPPSTVTFDSRSETVTLPGGVVSVAGVTVVTGGAELSCRSCLLGFGFWGLLTGISVVAVGLFGHRVDNSSGVSHLLAFGLVVLAVSLATVMGVFVCHYLKRRRGMAGGGDGKVMLIGERGSRCVKTITV